MNRIYITTIFLTFLGTPAEADIIYSFINQTHLQNGVAFSGSITTNGTLGVISSSDIVAYDVSFSKNASTFAWTSNAPPAGLFFSSGSLSATPTQFIFHNDLGIVTDLFLTTDITDFEAPFVRWHGSSFPGSGFYQRGGGPVETQFFANDPSFNGGSTQWILASATATSAAPEPTSIALFGLGLFACVGQAYRKRRKATKNSVT